MICLFKVNAKDHTEAQIFISWPLFTKSGGKKRIICILIPFTIDPKQSALLCPIPLLHSELEMRWHVILDPSLPQITQFFFLLRCQ